MGIFGKSKERRTSLLDAHDDAHEQDLRDAARRGDLATLIDLVEQGVNIEAADPQVLRAASLPTTPSSSLTSALAVALAGESPPAAIWQPPHLTTLVHHHLAPHLTSLCALFFRRVVKQPLWEQPKRVKSTVSAISLRKAPT